MVGVKKMASPVEDKKSDAVKLFQKASRTKLGYREKRLTRKNREDVQNDLKASKAKLKSPTADKEDILDTVYNEQVEIEQGALERHDSITGAAMAVMESPKPTLAARPLAAASTTATDANVAGGAAAESTRLRPVQKARVKVLKATRKAAKSGLAVRPLRAARASTASGNTAAVTALESEEASQAFDEMLGSAPPENLAVRLICKDCMTDPPNLIEYESEGGTVCVDCGLVVRGQRTYYH